MADPLCILMGAMDIIAGIVILILLNQYSIALIFALLMICKGIMSFSFFLN